MFSRRTKRTDDLVAHEMSDALDLPETNVKFRYAIITQQRTGSTLLSTALSDTGQAGVPTEYLNPRNISAYQERHRLKAPVKISNYLAQLERCRTTANGVFGIKCLHFHVQKHFKNNKTIGRFLERFDRLIFLYRQDKLAQAISNMKGHQSDVWQIPTTEDPCAVQVEHNLDLVLVARSLHVFTSQERHIRHLLRDWKRPYLELTYEELTNNFENTWDSVCKFLDIKNVPASSIEFKLRQQRDAKSEEMTEEFLQAIRNSDLYFKKD